MNITDAVGAWQTGSDYYKNDYKVRGNDHA